MAENKDNIDLDNREFQQVLQLINYTRQSIFMTGKAGAGKSTFLRYITQNTRKKHIVLAPTGIAAVNAGGVTLHSFFRIPLKPLLPDDPDFQIRRIRERMKYPASLIKLIKQLELIIIDEISMVRADIIDFIDKILRIYSSNMREPFGGKQLLLVGDLYQLEPVVTSEASNLLRQHYPNLFFFSAKVFERFGIVPIELRKVYRQTDSMFIEMLDRIRCGKPHQGDLTVLNSQVTVNEPTDADDFVMTLATQRDLVDSINDSHLSRIASPEITYHGIIEGEFPSSSMPTQLDLTVKAGAQVVFIRNDREKRWVNGTIGKVMTALPEMLEIELENGENHVVEPERWSNIKYVYNEETHRIDEIELGAFTQFPIKLAWALTVHKSQGLTFNKVIVDMGRGAFSSGQTYVALSRCRSLEGLTLKTPIRTQDIFVNQAILKFSQNFNAQSLLDNALESAKADDNYNKAAKAWDKGEITMAVDHFATAVSCRNELNDKAVIRLIKSKLSLVDRLKEEIEELKNQVGIYRDQLSSLADEYVIMGTECLGNQEDLQPALSNFDKALRLDKDSVPALRGRAETLMRMGETDLAIDSFRRLKELAPQDATSVFSLGELFFSSGELHEALNCYLSAFQTEPKNERFARRIGDLHEHTGDYEEAARWHALAAKLSRKRKK